MIRQNTGVYQPQIVAVQMADDQEWYPVTRFMIDSTVFMQPTSPGGWYIGLGQPGAQCSFYGPDGVHYAGPVSAMLAISTTWPPPS